MSVELYMEKERSEFIERMVRLDKERFPHRFCVDIKEAPKGFYPVKKSEFQDQVANPCSKCDARKLCIANADKWCSNNPCMSDRRKDAMSVIFKKV
jgi:hypothetical protein